MNRSDYMNGAVSFDDYYRSIAHAAHVSFAQSDKLADIKAALARGDEHLNSVPGMPLNVWDMRGAMLAYSPAYRAALKDHGEIDSMAVRVCVLKAAAVDGATTEGA